MERNNNHNNNHGSGNGFLLGVIVGVLLTLLFTTKRGRMILKEVTEKGLDKFANLEQLMQETGEELEDEDEEGDDYIPAEPVATPEPPKIQNVEKKQEETPEPAPKIVKEAPKFLEETHEEVETTEEETTPEPQPEEEKPKSTRVKRLFRGLRKKS
jgi:gas vesicle protein